MKNRLYDKINKVFIIAPLLAILAGCSTPRNTPDKSTPKILTVTAVGETDGENAPSSRVVMGESREPNSYPVLWSDSEKFIVSELIYDGDAYRLGKQNVNIETYDFVKSADGTRSTFKFNIEEYLFSIAAGYSYCALSPASGGRFETDDSRNDEPYIRFVLPQVQTPPSSTTCDESAMLLYAQSETSATQSADCRFAFNHVAAYGHLLLKGTDAGETITKVSMTNPSGPLSGEFGYYWLSGERYRADSRSNSITINCENITPTDGISELRFAVLPSTVSGLEIEVESSEGRVWHRTIDSEIVFSAGKSSRFGVDLTTAVRIE